MPQPKRGPRVAVIALDGLDPATIARESAAGTLPALAKVFRDAREVRLSGAGDIFFTSTWPCFASGVGVGNHGIHAFRPLKSGTLRFLDGDEFEVPAPFWETAVRAGLTASVLDVPICAPPHPDPALEGLRFVEWGAHPPLRPPASFPPALAPAIIERYGLHPCLADDAAVLSARDLKSMRERLCAGVLARERVVAHLLEERSPDLLVATFGEAHTAGHQFLNLDTPGHPCHDPAAASALGESQFSLVLEAVDAAVGRLLERLSPRTTVLVTCLGGLRPTYGGSQLLGDVLVRMGITVPARPRPAPLALARLIPARLRRPILRHMPALASAYSSALFLGSLDWTATRAFALPWSYDGYLRINQRGREPHGIVADGAERAALLAEVESAVRELTIAGTGARAVRQVVRPQEKWRGRAAAELPDLMVAWNNERPVDAVVSARLGRIENRDPGGRPAHTMAGALYAWGPRIQAGPRLAARDIDVAPTVLALLGVAPDHGLDGVPLHELLARAPAEAGA